MSCTSGGNVSASSYWRMTETTSTPGSPFLPSTSVISPSALWRPSGHFVMWTTTLLPVTAPPKAFFGTKMSMPIFVLSGVTKPNVLRASIVPTICSFARSRISMISPTRDWPSSSGGVTRATTWSPCMAVWSCVPGTKTSVSSSDSLTSGMMKPKPFDVMDRRPVTVFWLFESCSIKVLSFFALMFRFPRFFRFFRVAMLVEMVFPQ